MINPDYQVGSRLPEATLAKAQQLPDKPSPVILNGKIVRLAPLDLHRDTEMLFQLSNGQPIDLKDRSINEPYDADVMIWRYMSAGPFNSESELRDFLSAQVNARNGLCLCVRDRATDRPVGVFNYINNCPDHLKVELGNIWYSPIAQRTGANLEATYLALNHAFSLGYRRLEWKCDSLNERSSKAALRMGFTFEGIQEQHFIVKGRNRDTAWYRILDSEWGKVKGTLEALLHTMANR